MDTEHRRHGRIKDFVDFLNFEKMIPRAQRPQLPGAALFGIRADQVGIAAIDTTPFFHCRQIVLPAVTGPDRPASALGQHFVHFFR